MESHTETFENAGHGGLHQLPSTSTRCSYLGRLSRPRSPSTDRRRPRFVQSVERWSLCPVARTVGQTLSGRIHFEGSVDTNLRDLLSRQFGWQRLSSRQLPLGPSQRHVCPERVGQFERFHPARLWRPPGRRRYTKTHQSAALGRRQLHSLHDGGHRGSGSPTRSSRRRTSHRGGRRQPIKFSLNSLSTHTQRIFHHFS